ncbi:hypothetical protein MA04_02121 [Alcanivorax balearicus MACL04]|uniref:Uncharacterized protein n=1 Tax=Alloalcanivorax balearicus MACL04 TaxID=1177182 RepID=A0ABT2QZ84_9GAMM|nr:hypothetical protein [Alloalcanivorax balearicus]MCU5782821.1 hypothetical protein [Alloalcanivorax balearicus MACL04]
MGEFIKVLAEGFLKEDVPLVIIMVVVLAVLNAYKLYPLLVERKRHRLKGVEVALQSEYVQGMERECLKEQAATEHFYTATGIMMEKAPREALLKIYEGSGGRLPFVHFKRAVFHVRYEKGVFEIKLGLVDWLMMWAGLFSCRSAYSANRIRKEMDRQTKAESMPDKPAGEAASANV